MTRIERLLALLANHPKLEEARRLKSLIEAHPQWLTEYQTLLSMQKRLVRETVDGSRSAADTQRTIEGMLQKFEATPAVRQYLDALEELQEDFDAVAAVLNQELNRQ